MKPIIEKADIIEWAKKYDGPPFHALICDPPYHLQSIVRRFGAQNAAPAQHGKDGAFNRASRGFMGKSWDGGDVAFDPATWHALGQHLYPGAFGMAFASSRGWHRMAVAIEDAGFIIHPMIGWLYGSGFPKATRIDGQIDRMLGMEGERKITGKREHPTLKDKSKVSRDYSTQHHGNNSTQDEWDIVEPATELAKAWQGHRYGGQSMKPALEPIIVFQRPYEGKPVENMMETGAGALNIDGGRIGVDPSIDDMLREVQREKRKSDTWEDGNGFKNENNPLTGVPQEGRWPANFVLSHHPECRIIGETEDSYQINRFTGGAKPFGNGVGCEYDSEQMDGGKQDKWQCHPDCPVGKLAQQAGELKSGTGAVKKESAKGWQGSVYSQDSRAPGTPNVEYGDSGTADRFFFQSDWSYEIAEQLNASDSVYYCPKVSTRERNAGLDSRNPHPTLKPISLIRYLATLLLPPDIYAPDRRILVPFAGVGSEMIGAMLAGWDEVVGVELDNDDEYIPIAEKRISWWYEMMVNGYRDPKEILKIKPQKKPQNQLELFGE